MCTVSFIPTGQNSFILSSNRDESPERGVSDIERLIIKGEYVIFPKEIKGGSWIFASSLDQVICVLNGGFVKHKHRPPYARSRGIIMKEFFEYNDAIHFFSDIDLYNIEPFTSVVYDRNKLFEFVWDGQKKHIRELDKEMKHMWSSSTLYPPEIKEQRTKWFNEWFDLNPETTLENIKRLHRKGGKGNLHDGYVMNRNNLVCTVSITHIIKSKNKLEMIYEDLISKVKLSGSVNVNQLLA